MTASTAWTGAHDAWLRRHRFEQAGLRAAFDADYEAVQQVGARKDRLDKLIEQMAATSEYSNNVTRLGCLRGISTLTAFALAVEIGDWERFTGSTIGSFLGLVPSEFSSGQSRVQGSITKTGNTHARRLLVEAAWHHRKPYRPGAVMQARWAQAPGMAVARGDAGNHRLHRKWQQLTVRKKRPVIANVAVARELAGWCWSLAVMPDWQPLRPVGGDTDDSDGPARSDPRHSYEQPDSGRRSTLDKRSRSSRTARPAVTNPRISV